MSRAYNKYSNKKVNLDGYTFDSKIEARRYGELKLLSGAGKIVSLEVHPEYLITHRRKDICRVILDFKYWESYGTQKVEDVKGVDTAISRLKRKLVEAQYGIKVDLIRYGKR